MSLNERIKQEHKDKYKGKFARKLLRNMAKNEIRKSKEGQVSPLGRMAPRQKRKKRAKDLMIPFKRYYNGPVYNVVRALEKNDKGYYKMVKKEIKEVII